MTPYWWSPRLDELSDLATHVSGPALAEVEALIRVELCLTSTLHMAVFLGGGDPLAVGNPAFPDGPGGQFAPYAHVQALCQRLDALECRELGKRKLMVTEPPRHGKSTTCSVMFPVRYLVKRPDEPIMLASYEATVASRWGRKVRDLIDVHTDYLGIAVSDKSKAADLWELAGRDGGMLTAGVGGRFTSLGAKLLIIDDPVKNAEDAASAVIQDRNWDWYTQVAHTRKEPDAIELMILTRWNEADLGGRVLDEDGENWEVLNLPALAEADDPLGRSPGEALCPERYPVEELEATRSLIGATAFSALYQQRPTPAEGAQFRKAGFRYFEPYEADTAYYRLIGPDGTGDLVRVGDGFRFTITDLADTIKKKSDWTVISTWDLMPATDHDDEHRRAPSRLCLVDVRRVRVEGDTHLPLLHEIDTAYKPKWHGVEEQFLGRQLVKRAIRDGLHMKGLKADTDKLARSETASAWVREGRVFFRRGAAWLPTWEHELLVFPNGRWDDQVDVLSYACEEADRMRGLRLRAKNKDSRKSRLARRNRHRRHPELGKV